MQQNKLDYLKLVLFLASLTLALMGYFTSAITIKGQTVFVMHAMITSIFAVFASDSVVNILLRRNFEKRTTLAQKEFFGHLYHLNNFQADAGRNIRISVFFLLFITAPTIISQEWFLAAPFCILGLIFALYTKANMKEFNSYVDQCVLPLSIINE